MLTAITPETIQLGSQALIFAGMRNRRTSKNGKCYRLVTLLEAFLSSESSPIDLIAVAGSVYGRLNVSAERFPNSPA